MEVDRELIDFLEQRFEKSERHGQEMIRQTQVLIEDLRSQIQLVAEGVVGQQQQLDGFRREMAAEFRETKALIRLSYAERECRSLPGSEDDELGPELGEGDHSTAPGRRGGFLLSPDAYQADR
jgi:hypothetical protein